MLKNFFDLPNTFEPDERRRRQILHILSIVSVLGLMSVLLMTFLAMYLPGGRAILSYKGIVAGVTAAATLMVISSVMLFVNRLSTIPSWLSATAMLVVGISIFSQSDSPEELYNGLSALIWSIPIVLA